jgi:hypothetical protein
MSGTKTNPKPKSRAQLPTITFDAELDPREDPFFFLVRSASSLYSGAPTRHVSLPRLLGGPDIPSLLI